MTQNLLVYALFMLVSFVKKKKKLTSIFNIYAKLTDVLLKMLVIFWIKKNVNKNNNDYVGSIIQAFLSFCLLFSYASRILSKKMRPPNIFQFLMALNKHSHTVRLPSFPHSKLVLLLTHLQYF